ncbi:tyrosine-type recombinase/integrase [Streptomyces sp. NPDC059835]|uniref:tyrosine-type recombinase/integrase n=1 Tax=Streptomyces sp. NPDC059835 TaxID=3346967 RepID=UPI0036685908
MARVWIEDRATQATYIAAVARWKKSGKRRQAPARWRVRWYDEHRKPKAESFQTKPEAEKHQTRITNELNGVTAPPPVTTGETFAAEAAQWLSGKRRITDRTRGDYQEILDLHVLPEWGDRLLSAITWDQVDAWLTRLGEMPGRSEGTTLSPSRIVKFYRVGGMVAKRAVRAGRLAANPFQGHELPRVGDGGEHFYLDHAGVERLAVEAAAIRPEYGTLVRLQAYCGPRWGELTAITCERWNRERSEIRITHAWSVLKGGRAVMGDTKTHERRTLPVPSFLVEELDALAAGRRGEALLFTGPDGGRLTYVVFRRRWLQALEAAGLKGKRVKLRHTAASLAVASGASIKDVQQMMGHKNAAMTLNVYAHLWPEGLRDVSDRMAAARTAALAA